METTRYWTWHRNRQTHCDGVVHTCDGKTRALLNIPGCGLNSDTEEVVFTHGGRVNGYSPFMTYGTQFSQVFSYIIELRKKICVNMM